MATISLVYEDPNYDLRVEGLHLAAGIEIGNTGGPAQSQFLVQEDSSSSDGR